MEKICPVCHKIFEAKGKHHIYCSVHCRKIHHKLVYYDKSCIIKWENDVNTSVIRKFTCKNCHKIVEVTDERDKRRKFCCPHCEKLYWKHPEKYKVTETLLKSV